MTGRGRGTVAVVAVALALLVPAAAAAHAFIVKTVPTASVVINPAPTSVQLTFDEAVEPRFAVISVTDAAAHQETTGPVTRSPSNPDTLVVPIRRVGEGWYLVYWRAISVDGHPVQGAFTFAVGPNAGPAPEFVIPHIAGTATSTPLVIAKWLAFLAVMGAIGLFALRIAIARPLVRRVSGTSLRALSIAFGVAAGLALVAVPVYLEEAVAIDSLRSFWDVTGVVPLWRLTAFGRGFVDLELCLALFVVAASVAILVDRPQQKGRSVAAILALSGALAAAAAVLLLPGTIGHAGQTSPRGVAVLLDWLHLVSGSVWFGGLIGLLVVWRSLPVGKRVAGLVVCVPRFSIVALVSVLVLLGTGLGATVLHLPVLDALWLTTYGKLILLKAALLLAALLLASINLLRAKPGLSRAERGEASARLLRTLVGGEAVLVAGAILAAAVLSGVAPPPPAFAAAGSALAHVAGSNVAANLTQDGYAMTVLVSPNQAAAPSTFGLRLTRGGRPVEGANVTLMFNMLDMQMPSQEYQLTETAPGLYTRTTAALVMVGHWGLSFRVAPKGEQPFTVLVVDRAG